MNQSLTQTAKILTLAVILSVGASYVYAWTAPTATPPGGNVSAPVNVSDNFQYKDGGLLLNQAGSFVNGLIVRYGNVGIGTVSPQAKLHIYNNTSPGSEILIDGGWGGRAKLSVSQISGDPFKISHDWGIQLHTLDTSNVDHYMAMDRNGNVGIGTASPTEKLEVAGNIKASGDICAQGGAKCLSTAGGGGVTSISAGSGISVSGNTGAVTVSATNNSTKPCATGYTRIGPNFCKADLFNGPGQLVYTYNEACAQTTALTGVTDAKAVLGRLGLRVMASNVAGTANSNVLSSTQTYFYGPTDACVKYSDSYVSATHEWASVPVNTNLGGEEFEVIFQTNTNGQTYVRSAKTSGTTPSANIVVVGYFD